MCRHVSSAATGLARGARREEMQGLTVLPVDTNITADTTGVLIPPARAQPFLGAPQHYEIAGGRNLQGGEAH